MDIQEKDYFEFIDSDLKDNGEKIVLSLNDQYFANHPLNLSWAQAQNIITTVKPIPWVVWVIGRSVFGSGDSLGSPDYTMFANFDYLLINAAFEGAFIEKVGNKLTPNANFEEIVNALGSDICSALCIVHAAVRCVKAELPISLWRPMVDDALIRVQLGFMLGQYARDFGSGRAMLAGFSGRIGAMMQFVFGTDAKAENAMERLAVGYDFQEVGNKIYGCDPLQVSALLLLSAGVSKNAAHGVASYSIKTSLHEDSLTQKWFSAFSIIENLRQQRGENISEQEWQNLGIDFEDRQIIVLKCDRLITSGHNLDFVLMEGAKI